MLEADISVIIPMYNAEKNIKKLIYCLLDQTQSPREIIVVNDGSTDCSEEIVLDCCRVTSRVRLINKENGGTSSAKNLGLKNATSRYIMFVDSDDLLSDDYIEKHYEKTNEDIWVCSGMQIIYESNNKVVKMTPTEMYQERLEITNFLYRVEKAELFNVDVSKVYSLKVLKENNILFDESISLGEDLKFNCEYAKHVQYGVLMNYAGYRYIRREGDSLVSCFKSDLERQIEESIISRKKLYSHYNLLDELFFRDRYLNTFVGSCLLLIPNLYRNGCNMSKQEKVETIRKVTKRIRKYENVKLNNRVIDFFKMIILKFRPGISYKILTVLFWIRNKCPIVRRLYT